MTSFGSGLPEFLAHWYRCPFLATTGWQCPGCGGTRAVLAVLHGDLGTALRMNAAVVLMVGISVGLALYQVAAAVRLGKLERLHIPMWALASTGSAVVLFGVCRNF